MFYQAELQFLRQMLEKLHLQTVLVSGEQEIASLPNLGLHSFLGREEEYRQFFCDIPQRTAPNTIYKLTDGYLCNYILLLLPDVQPATVLLTGPYMSVQLSHQQLLREAERFSVPPQQFRQMESYYSAIPVVSDDRFLFAMMNTFGETVWGGSDAFAVVDLAQEFSTENMPLPGRGEAPSSEETLLNMQVMEQRYAHENELLQAVTQGLVHKAEQILSNMSRQAIEQRVADPVRNLKNYCIIMNTLLRKAAEQGLVHPVYLDRTSADFARRIELLPSTAAGQRLMNDMVHTYCRLVKKHSMAHFSAPIRKTLACIDNDLTGDLSLRALASMQNLSAGYLSSLFKKETGQTLTDYVNSKRVELSVRLLRTTTLQVQTIAQYCGIPDVNYFSKMFKRYVGVTPKEFRRTVQNYGGQS